MKKYPYSLLAYGLLLSSSIACIAFIFLMSEKFVTHFIWKYLESSHLYLGLSLVVGGFIIYYLKQKWGNLPRTSHDVMQEFKSKKTLDYRHTWKNLVLALFILILGAGVGPEAPLLGAVISYSIWQADKLRYLHAHQETFHRHTFKEKISILFHPTQYLIPYSNSAKHDQFTMSRRMIIILTLNGLLVFTILMRMTDQPSFITKLGNSQWRLQDLIIIVPLLLYGTLFGKLYHYGLKVIKNRLKDIHLSLLIRIFIGASAIFLIAIFVPNLLFSGQHSMAVIVENGMTLSPILLIGLSFVKLIFLEICLETGWTGGDIFPVTFASILQGFAFAQLFSGYDTLFIVLIVSLSLAANILKNTWLAGIFITLFFPPNLIPITLILAFILLGIDHILTTKSWQVTKN